VEQIDTITIGSVWLGSVTFQCPASQTWHLTRAAVHPDDPAGLVSTSAPLGLAVYAASGVNPGALVEAGQFLGAGVATWDTPIILAPGAPLTFALHASSPALVGDDYTVRIEGWFQ
jgi:hypothetical protein